MADKSILGHINCPYCGTQGGMRITLDKNESPFGFCEANCDGQLRIGGKPRRVAAFLKLHPHIAQAMQPKPAENPVTVTAAKPAVTVPEKPAKAASPGFSLDSL
ncbi:MAG: hypothetical protein JNJ51_08425 [Methylobacillus glycogenes]|nr:hypothetical protein [Methylobacillus glycogenes]